MAVLPFAEHLVKAVPSCVPTTLAWSVPTIDHGLGKNSRGNIVSRTSPTVDQCPAKDVK